MKRFALSISAVLFVGVFATQARAADVHINVHFGAPPPIFLHAAPTMVYLPQPAVYVAVGIPYDLFFVGGHYYYVRGNNWYWGPGYGGPWTRAVSLPPGLRKYRVEHLREFRDYEYRTVRVSRHDVRSKHFVADYGPGKGKGRGRGRR